MQFRHKFQENMQGLLPLAILSDLSPPQKKKIIINKYNAIPFRYLILAQIHQKYKAYPMRFNLILAKYQQKYKAISSDFSPISSKMQGFTIAILSDFRPIS